MNHYRANWGFEMSAHKNLLVALALFAASAGIAHAESKEAIVLHGGNGRQLTDILPLEPGQKPPTVLRGGSGRQFIDLRPDLPSSVTILRGRRPADDPK
jgi:hypothetical protein